MNDADACLPGPLKDFVFDLHDSARRSHLPAEQSTLYNGTFRDLTAKYFASGPWPSPQSVSSECGGDGLFLALYRELTQRHLHSVTRPQVSDRVEGWHVYKSLFDLLLSEVEQAASDGGGPPRDGLFLLPEWSFDILHEFVYQFQGFCQFRTATYAAAARGAEGGGKAVPNHVAEALDVLGQNRDAWAVEAVLSYLTRLVRAGTTNKKATPPPPPAYRYLALFASVALSRLECLLGDYTASLAALGPVTDTTAPPLQLGDELRTPLEVVHSVVPARLSMSYHAGVSYLMLRRYRDASSILGQMCSYMQRGFKTGQLRGGPHSDQYGRQYDRMVALLAILTHVCPTQGIVEDSVLRSVRDKHSVQLSKIEAGEEGYEDLFIFACPKFVSPAVPDYGQATTASGDGASSGGGQEEAYKLQVRQFMTEMGVQQTLRKLRSYMKLYTSIGVSKLAAFNDAQEDDFRPLLLCYKHKMRQLERTTTVPAASATGAAADASDKKAGAAGSEQASPPSSSSASSSPLDGTPKMALDIHYYVVDDMVHVDEAEKQRRFENYFMAQIEQNSEILRDAEGVATEV